MKREKAVVWKDFNSEPQRKCLSLLSTVICREPSTSVGRSIHEDFLLPSIAGSLLNCTDSENKYFLKIIPYKTGFANFDTLFSFLRYLLKYKFLGHKINIKYMSTGKVLSAFSQQGCFSTPFLLPILTLVLNLHCWGWLFKRISCKLPFLRTLAYILKVTNT